MTCPSGGSTNSDRGVIRQVKSCPDPCRLGPLSMHLYRPFHSALGVSLDGAEEVVFPIPLTIPSSHDVER